MSFIKIFRYDLHQGLLRRWYLLLPALVFSIALSIGTIQNARLYQHISTSDMTAGYLFACFFEGIDEYIPAPGVAFKLPLEWFLLLIYPLCLAADYPVRDLKGVGGIVLLKTGSRLCWILSKLCWAVAETIVYWLTLILGAVLVGAAVCSPSLMPDREHLAYLLGDSFAGQSIPGILLCVYLLPLLVMLIGSVLHAVLSLCLSPFFSVLILTALRVAAAYYMQPLLPDEYSMLVRNRLVVDNGFSPIAGIGLCIVILTICFILGSIFFCHYDILRKKEV